VNINVVGVWHTGNWIPTSGCACHLSFPLYFRP